MTARDLKLARERGRALPRHHPLYRRKLELSAEHTALAFGHRSLLENCPLFLCLILGVHSTGTGGVATRHGAVLIHRSDRHAPRPHSPGGIKKARSLAGSRAQFRLWIFSYHVLASLPKIMLSRINIACIVGGFPPTRAGIIQP